MLSLHKKLNRTGAHPVKTGTPFAKNKIEGDSKWLIHVRIAARSLTIPAISVIQPRKKFPAPIAELTMSVSTMSVKAN
jgi:hypothetical protein